MRWNLTTRILLGLGAGVVVGLFFGEGCAPLALLGDAFIGLLQMTVLPYVVVALTGSLGRLTFGEGRRLLVAGAAVQGLLWLVGLVVIALLPLSWPSWQSARFYDPGAHGAAPGIDFLGLYIPANIFQSLANNAVPAVVLFCFFVGVAIMGLERKQALLEPLDTLARVFVRVNVFMVRLTPYGVFAIAAAAAGTMTTEELGRLQAYLITYTLGVGLFAFLVLPALLAACTPFRYGQILRAYRDPLVTAFATGKIIVVLPLLVECTRRLYEEQQVTQADVGQTAETLYPLAHAFPHLGKLFGLLFIPFAAWYVGSPLAAAHYPTFLASGLVTYFGGALLATPFLLHALQLPSDMMRLFLASGLYCSRVGDLLGTMHLVALTLLTTSFLTGTLRPRWRRLALSLGGTLLLGAAVLAGTRVYLAGALEGAYDSDDLYLAMGLVSPPAPAQILEEPAPCPVPLRPGQTRLDRIRERGVLRVGFDDGQLPLAHRNARGELVGFDIDMAHRLAGDLEVRLEFVPYEATTLPRQLAEDHFDLAMSGVVGGVANARTMALTNPYLDLTLALVVPDHRKDDFADRASIARLGPVRVAVQQESPFTRRAETMFPNVRFVVVPSPRAYFEGAAADALLVSAETGSAWTILHPAYDVVPLPGMLSVPLVVATGPGDEGFRVFLDRWIDVLHRDGTIARLREHWLLGRDEKAWRPRWSVVRDVLHWTD